MKNILHITPHLGGGIGTVLLNWLTYDKSNRHSVITLDYANQKGTDICKENNIELFSQLPVNEIIPKIESADISVIHFWNHPLLYDFLIRNNLPKSRIIFWSHISGAKPPYVFNTKLLDLCEKFVFTNQISHKYMPKSSKLSCILSTGGTERFENLKKEAHEGYFAGYIGTVDFAKMHPCYAETLAKTDADKIFIVGGGKNADNFKSFSPRFEVTGKIDDVGEILKKLDVFAYLLNPDHYGTGEQVLQEAMSAGVVPVVLNNPCEMSLVKHMETGLIAENPDEYIEYINLLKKDIKLRETLSQKAKTFAQDNFSLKNLTANWNRVFDEVIKLPKTEKYWNTDKKSLTSYDIFKESLGDFSDTFENKTEQELKELLKQPNWASDTKGTPKQYYEFLGGDELEKLCELY